MDRRSSESCTATIMNYDDDGNAFVEIDVENDQGFLIGLDESEIKSIEVTEL